MSSLVRSRGVLVVLSLLLVVAITGCERTNRVIADSTAPTDVPTYSEKASTIQAHPAADMKR